MNPWTGVSAEFIVWSRDNGCDDPNTKLDPTGIIFYYKGWATWVENHLLWTDSVDQWTNQGANEQGFYAGSPNVCTTNQVGDATAEWYSSRYHIRVAKVGSFTGWGVTAMSSPHYDTVSWDCGLVPSHVVHNGDFDNGKYRYIQGLGSTGHHPYKYKYWSMSARSHMSVQCNGEPSGTTGQVAIMRMETEGNTSGGG